MNLNDLPDDCLMAIFDFVNSLGDLRNLFKVCTRWQALISSQLSKYKVLQDVYSDNLKNLSRKLTDKGLPYEYECELKCATIDTNTTSLEDMKIIIKLMSNLKILIVPLARHDLRVKRFMDIYKMAGSISGVVIRDRLDYFTLGNTQNIEMFVINGRMLPSMSLFPNLKQLYVFDYCPMSIIQSFRHFPKVERLNIRIQPWLTGIRSREFVTMDKSLSKLTILECAIKNKRAFVMTDELIGSFSPSKPFDPTILLKQCPSLESFFISMSDAYILTEKNDYSFPSCRDLVIESYRCETYGSDKSDFDKLPKFLTKFPNLKHLSLRGYELKVDEMKRIIKMLPNLILLDIRRSSLENVRVIESVLDNSKHNVTLLHDANILDVKINEEWPHLSRALNAKDLRICKGLDFMANCFFYSFRYLPRIMDPID